MLFASNMRLLTVCVVFGALTALVSARGTPAHLKPCDSMGMEELCRHKERCKKLIPDLLTICKTTYKIDAPENRVEIIDERRRELLIIQIEGVVNYEDASPPVILQGPRNLTVPPQTEYQFECKAEGAPTPKVTITRLEEASLERVDSSHDSKVDLSAVKVIHKNDRVQFTDEGWYRCVASNTRGVVFADAYLRVYDLCKDLTCPVGKICKADYETETVECICPPCNAGKYEPLCGSDCATYFNYCELQNKNCQQGTTYYKFSDNFCPLFSAPEFIEQPPADVEAEEDVEFKLTCRAQPAGDSPGPPPIISWYRAKIPEPAPTGVPTEEFTEATEAPVEEPDYNAKLGDGEVIILSFAEGDSPTIFCVAHQCKHGEKFPYDLVGDPIEINVAPGELNFHPGKSCQIFGDPHVLTFDGAVHHFQGECEYVLAMDCESATWYIYGEFVDCAGDGKGFACLNSVTLYWQNSIMIEMQRGWVLNNNGVRVTFKQDQFQQIFAANGVDQVGLLFDGEWLSISFSNGYQLRWDGLMSAQILTGQPSPATCGLCGNSNDDPADDFTARSGMGGTGDVTTLDTFGDSWKVDRYNQCKNMAGSYKWDWESEYAWKRAEAETVCSNVFNTPQFDTCGTVIPGGMPHINSAPYQEACIMDYMRSEFFRGEYRIECNAAASYAERCGNKGHKIHQWRKQSGCAGDYLDFLKFQNFVLDQGCSQDEPPFVIKENYV